MSATRAAESDRDTALFPLPARDKLLLTVAIMAATLMQILDSTIANVALPHMQAALGATQDSATWVLTSYIVASAAAIPITGWLADRVGSRRLFLFSNMLFIAASMLCGIANSLVEMVAFRVLQGVAGAFMLPLAQTAMLDINPRARHGQAMAIYGMGIMVGPVLGPILGGWLTENFSWRWVFYVNLPIGLLSLTGLWLLLPQRPLVRRSFDIMGFSCLAVALAALQLALDRGGHVDWFEATEIWIEFGTAIAFFWMFVVHLLTGRNPLFHREMMADRNLLMGMLFLFINGLIMMSGMALLPTMLQNVYGNPVLAAGTLLAARGIGVFVGMWLASRVADRTDPRAMVMFGFALVALSLWQMVHWSLEIDGQVVVMSGLLQGLGLGMVFLSLNLVTFATLKFEYRTDASAVINLSRSLGSSVGISIVTALLARNIQTSHSDLAAHITPFSLPVDPTMALGLGQTGEAVISLIDAEINRQATLIAYVDDFYLMMWITLAVLPLALLLRRAKGPPPKDDVHMVME